LAFIAGPIVWALLRLIGVPIVATLPAVKTLLIIAMVSPVLEEIVFRGGLQPWLGNQSFIPSQSVAGITAANVLTSVVFAAFHLFNQPPLWAAAVFLPSLVFGWIRDRSGSVWPCIVLHIWYNVGFVLLFVA